MRILLLTQIYSDKPVSGGVRIIWNYSQELARQGAEVFVVANIIDTDNLPRQENLKIYRVPFGSYALEPLKQDVLMSFFFSIPLILWHRIQIIHMVPIQSPCPFSRFKFGTKFVESAERTWDYDGKFKDDLKRDRQSKKSRSFTLFQKIFIRFSRIFYSLFALDEEYPTGTDAFFCRSRSLFQYLRANGIKSKLFYIPIGVNTIEFHPKQSAPKKNTKFIFLSSAALSYRKGTHHLIEAYNEFSKKHENSSKLWLIGNSEAGIPKELKQRANSNASIKFLGEVAPNKIADYYNLCDVYVSAALIGDQGPIQPNALEAMASGKPLIISEYGETRELSEKKVAVTFETGNIRALTSAMEKLFFDKALRDELSKNSVQYVKDNFDWQVLTARCLEYYKQILSKL